MINEETAQETTTASSYCFKNPMIGLQGTKLSESLKASFITRQYVYTYSSSDIHVLSTKMHMYSM